MNKTKQKTLLVILAVLTLLTVVFIFSNSMKSGEESREASGRFSEIFDSAVRFLFGEDADVNYIVRKGAHLAEFALLGALTFLLVRALTEFSGVKLLSCGLFGTLAVAVIDEYIQTFTGRTSLVSDVLIDFSGALLGMLAAFLCYIVIRKCRK